MRQIARSLYDKGAGLAVNYYWEPRGTPVGARDWQNGFTFPKPGTYPVKVRMEVAPFARISKTEPRVMLTRVVPALVDIVVVGEAKPPVTATGGRWVLANKVIDDNIKPSGSDRALGGFRQVHETKGSATATSVSCTYTYTAERPKAETQPGTIFAPPQVLPRFLKQVYVRNATWTLPPERLSVGEKITLSLAMDAKGSEVVCDPPGARGADADVTSSGNLTCAVRLQPSKEQSSGGGNVTPSQQLLQTVMNTTEGRKQSVWDVPAFDRTRHVLLFSLRFTPQFLSDIGYTATYEYRFQPGGGQ